MMNHSLRSIFAHKLFPHVPALVCAFLSASLLCAEDSGSAQSVEAMTTLHLRQQNAVDAKAQLIPQKYLAAGAKCARIRGSKVRMRQKPTLDSPIIRQVQNGEAILIGGEAEGFTEIFPSIDQKAYVFRTYILDNQVEGKKVNIRLSPDLKAPIIAQLSQGDKVEGTVCSSSRKWLEIDMPLSTRFYVYSKYIEPISPHEYASLTEKASSTPSSSTPKAAENTSAKHLTPAPHAPAKKNPEEKPTAVEKSAQSKKQLANTPVSRPTLTSRADLPALWHSLENSIFELWQHAHPESTLEDYETGQNIAAHEINGLLAPYDSAIQTPPGDYILELNAGEKAFLYSNKIDLSTFTGQYVQLKVLERDSSNFAWPTYVVLDIQDIATENSSDANSN